MQERVFEWVMASVRNASVAEKTLLLTLYWQRLIGTDTKGVEISAGVSLCELWRMISAYTVLNANSQAVVFVLAVAIVTTVFALLPKTSVIKLLMTK